MRVEELFLGGCVLPEIDECNCKCHEPGSSIKHKRPCCSRCSRCERRVRIGWIESHKTNCPAKNMEGS